MSLPPSDHLLRTLAAVAPSSRVLDLGCGRGRHTAPLASLGFDLYACTSESTDAAATRAAVEAELGKEKAEQRVSMARSAALGYPDDFFDWVVAYGAYDEAANMAMLVDMLSETYRVLKPGGWVFVAMRERAIGADATPEALTRLFVQVQFA
ncbi:MAG: class I SAM-dependent methyltransferase, partial [Rhodothermaceae bacterium]|nr:class I SAM-dependent methyltransferase [Rhodothermaceae bacterium]